MRGGFLLIFLITVGASVVGAQTLAESAVSSHGRQLLYSQKIPAVTDSATSYYPGNITASDMDTWDWNDDYFQERVLYAALTGIIIALLSGFSCVSWMFARLSAANCGEDNCCRTGPIWWIICGTKGPAVEGYSGRQRFVLFVLLLFLTIWIVCCCLIGIRGVNYVVDGAVETFDQAMSAISTMEANNALAQTAMTSIGITYDAASMDSAVSSVKTTVGDLETTIDSNSDNMKHAAYIFYSFFFLNLLLGFLAYACGYGCFSMMMAFFGYMLVVGAWLLFAFFYASGVYLDDTCVQLQLWNDCKAYGADTAALSCDTDLTLDRAITCPNSGSFTSEYNATYILLQDKIAAYNAAYPSTSPRPTFEIPGATTGLQQITSTSADSYRNNEYYRMNLYTQQALVIAGCSPTGAASPTSYTSSCVTTCGDTDLTSPTTEACHQKGVLATADVLITLSYTASCSYVTDMAAQAVQSGSSCDMLGEGFVYEFGSQGCIGMLYFFVIYIGVKGYHVWTSPTEDQLEMQAEIAMIHEVEERQAVVGSVSAGVARAAEKQRQEEEDAFEAEENAELDDFLKGYYSKWTGVPGPPPESFFASVLNLAMVQQGDHGQAEESRTSQEVNDDDDDDDDDAGEQLEPAMVPMERTKSLAPEPVSPASQHLPSNITLAEDLPLQGH